MKIKTRKIQFQWWEKHWDQQVWVIVTALLILLIVAWGGWASTYGVTSQGRDAEITALIIATHNWEVASDKLDRLKQLVMANPVSVTDSENALIKAENDLDTATKNFEATGFRALYGELIILSAVLLQIIAALFLTNAIASILARMHQGGHVLDVNKLRKDWIKKLHTGQALKNEDEILILIEDEAENFELSRADVLRGQQVITTYKRVITTCRKAKPEEIPWQQISSLFYKLALVCKQRISLGEENWSQQEASIRNQYQELRQIISQDIRESAFSAILIPVLFISIFTGLSLYWNSLIGETLGQQLVFWRAPVLWVGASFAANGILRIWGSSFVRWLTEKKTGNFDDVLVGAFIEPLSALIMVFPFLIALDILTGPASPPFEFGPFLTWIGYEATASASRALIVVLVCTWSAVFILNRLIPKILTLWVSVIDEVAIKIIQLIVTSLIIVVGVILELFLIQNPIREALGNDLTTLVTIFATIIVAVVGYASRFIFDNLLGGISLQIEKPFEIGDRIELPDGRLGEVVAMGLRSTLFHDIDNASEIAIPNSELARYSITNMSRMDSSRLNIHVWITDPAQVKLTQALLLDIAYLEKEIDQMRVFGAELSSNEREKMKENLVLSNNRNTIEESMERLVARHVKIRKTIVSQIIGGGISEPERVFDLSEDTMRDPWRKVIKKIESLREGYQESLKEENKWLLDGVKKSEDNRPEDMLRNYRRAVNEVVFADSTSPEFDLNRLIGDVELRERIEKNKLPKALLDLAKDAPTKADVDEETLKDVKGTLTRFEDKRLGIVLNISDEAATLENYIYAIGEEYPAVRSELDGIIQEMNREPSVFSEYSDDGHVQLTLNCYPLYFERGLEIQHKINREIGLRFSHAGIKFIRAV